MSAAAWKISGDPRSASLRMALEMYVANQPITVIARRIGATPAAVRDMLGSAKGRGLLVVVQQGANQPAPEPAAAPVAPPPLPKVSQPAGSVMRWTPEHDDIVRKLWIAGATCEEIGQRLGRSKGSISGRVSRLGLPIRGSGPKQRRALPTKRKAAAPEPAPTPEPVAAPASAAVSAPKPQPIGRNQCHWIEGDPREVQTKGDAIYCGQPVELGRPYCSAHCDRAYIGRAERAGIKPPTLAEMIGRKPRAPEPVAAAQPVEPAPAPKPKAKPPAKPRKRGAPVSAFQRGAPMRIGNALIPQQAKVVLSLFVAGQSLRQIAEATGLTRGQVAGTIHRAKERNWLVEVGEQ